MMRLDALQSPQSLDRHAVCSTALKSCRCRAARLQRMRRAMWFRMSCVIPATTSRGRAAGTRRLYVNKEEKTTPARAHTHKQGPSLVTFAFHASAKPSMTFHIRVHGTRWGAPSSNLRGIMAGGLARVLGLDGL